MNLWMYSIQIFDFKMKVKDVEDLDKSCAGEPTLSTCMCAKMCTSRSSHLFAVHNRTFCYQTYGWMHGQMLIINENRIICIICIINKQILLAYTSFRKNQCKKNATNLKLVLFLTNIQSS